MIFSKHVLQPKKRLVTASRLLLFFILLSIRRYWVQRKKSIFWKSSFKISYFQKSFLHALAVLGYLPILKGCVEVTSFQCTFSTCFFHKIGSCLIFYQLTKFQYHLLSFLRYQIKCIFKFWFSQFITS